MFVCVPKFVFPAVFVRFNVPAVSTPLCVTVPEAVTLKFPLTFDAPKSIPFTSFNVTSLPFVTFTVLKSFPILSKVILFEAPAAKVVVPVTLSAPLFVIAPFVVTLNVPLTVDAPRSIAFVSTNVTFLPLVICTVPKSFAA